MILKALRQLRRRDLTFPLLWDVFMVYVASLNVGLIAFDLTYLKLRPLYFRTVPALTRVYDHVKGIEAEPLTSAILENARAVGRILDGKASEDELEGHLATLRRLSRRMVLENPFERSGQTHNLQIVERVMAEAVTGVPARDRETLLDDVDAFWSSSADGGLRRHMEVFERHIAPLLAVDYYRGYGLDGRLEDRFWALDLPFLLLFWVEFAVRWVTSIRRRTFPRWFFFPLVNWYDALGLVPNRTFRVFRLFRVIAIYVRLRRSGLTGVGDDPVSRTVAFLAGAIAEEVSDMVALRILSELQEEVAGGTHLEIIGRTVLARREALEGMLLSQLRDVLAREGTQARLREVYGIALGNAVERSRALQQVPLPAAVVRPLVRYLGGVVFEAVLETAVTTLESEEGRRAVAELVSSVVDESLSGGEIAELDAVTREVVVELLERMKERVAVKKWMGDYTAPATPDP